MSIQSSINQMLSSVANQQLFRGLTAKVGEIKTNTGNLTEEQKRLSELIKKHGSIQAVEDAADIGKDAMDAELEARLKYPNFDTIVAHVQSRIKNIAQTRVNMQRILYEDNQDAVKERVEQSKGGAQK